MQSIQSLFPKIGFFSILDVLLVALIIYQLYNLIRGTIAANIFIGFAVILPLILW
jgi:diadenylate cyclase